MSDQKDQKNKVEPDTENPWDAFSDQESLWPRQGDQPKASSGEDSDIFEAGQSVSDPTSQKRSEQKKAPALKTQRKNSEVSETSEAEAEHTASLRPERLKPEPLQIDPVYSKGVSSDSVPKSNPKSGETSLKESETPASEAKKSKGASRAQDRRQSRRAKLRPELLYALAGAAIFGAGAGGFWVGHDMGYERGLAYVPQHIPSIGGVLKMSPEDAGGLKIPNQGSPSYEIIAGDDTARTPSEGRARSSETPLSQTALLGDGTVDGAPSSNSVKDPGDPVVLGSSAAGTGTQSQNAVNAPQAPSVSEQGPSVSEQGKVSSRLNADRSSDEDLTRTVQEALAAASGSASEPRAPESIKEPYRVQLASFVDPATAESERKRLQSLYRDLVGNLQIVETVVKGKTQYQIKGPVLPVAEARQACTALKSRGGDCFVKRD